MNSSDFAVVVGVSRYPGYAEPPPPLASLKGPDNDAEAIRDWLVEEAGGGLPTGNVRLIRSLDFPDPFPGQDGWGPTGEAIRKALADLRKLPPVDGAQVGRRLYVYASGHGFASKRADGALLTAEGEKGRMLHVWISDWFEHLYNAALFKEYVLWMDCCMTRDLLTQPQPCDLRFQFGSDLDAGLAFSAFSARFPKRAVEGLMPNGKAHGVFTYALLQGLRGAAADPATGEVTTARLKGYLLGSMGALMSPQDQANPEVSKQPDFGLQDDFVLARVAPAEAPRVPPAPPHFGMRAGLGMAPKVPRPAAMPAPAAARVKLVVLPASPLAEVFLVGSGFELVGRSIGRLESEVQAGAYTLRVELGAETIERQVVLDRDRTIDLGSAPGFASPAPLEGTTRTHEPHMETAAKASTAAPLRAGSGARLLLVARRWTSRDPPARGAASPARGVLLRTAGGELVADLDEVGTSAEGGDPCLARAVEVDPGAYALTWPAGPGAWAEQTLIATGGWQTQAFLLRDASGADEQAGLAILMGQGGFDPGDPQGRLAEEARLALADERQVASAFVAETLFRKFTDPMLGLMGAHLMLLARESGARAERRGAKGQGLRAPVAFDQGLFDEVAGNLLGLLGPAHPDVTALLTQATRPDLDALEPITAAPVFWRSWPLLVEASNERPDLVPVATWLRFAAILPMRPYLVWRPAEDAALERARLLEHLRAALAGVRDDPAGAARRELSRRLLVPHAALDEAAGSPG